MPNAPIRICWTISFGIKANESCVYYTIERHETTTDVQINILFAYYSK